MFETSNRQSDIEHDRLVSDWCLFCTTKNGIKPRVHSVTGVYWLTNHFELLLKMTSFVSKVSVSELSHDLSRIGTSILTQQSVCCAHHYSSAVSVVNLSIDHYLRLCLYSVNFSFCSSLIDWLVQYYWSSKTKQAKQSKAKHEVPSEQQHQQQLLLFTGSIDTRGCHCCWLDTASFIPRVFVL